MRPAKASSIFDQSRNYPSMNLESLASQLRGFVGITRKKQIGSLMQFFPIESERIIASFGEDAAVIDDGEEVMLLAADGIWSKLMEVDPEWSGYCSVLVNVHDIAAMGGWPVAMVDVLSVDNQEIAEKVLRGMKKAIEKFHVPIIGGHLHPDTPYSALDVAILGKAKKSGVILSSTARAGEVVVAAADMDGQAHPRFAINFDSTSFKDSKTLLMQLGCYAGAGREGSGQGGKGYQQSRAAGNPGHAAGDEPGGRDGGRGRDCRSRGPGPGQLAEDVSGNGLCGHRKAGERGEGLGGIREARPDGQGDRPGDGGEKAGHSRGEEEAVLFDLEKECVTGIH